MIIQSVNPATGKVIKEYREHAPGDVDEIIDVAQDAYAAWKDKSFSDRAVPMAKAAKVLREQKDDFARLMAQEMGKPVREGVAEAEKCAWVCEYYAEHAAAFLADEAVQTDASKSFITYRPLGLLLAIMPWNFPFWQVFRFAAPAIMAGNGVLLKHASNVPGCALAIEQVFKVAGFPQDLFRTLMIGSRAVNGVIQHENVVAVTLTGSTPAGRMVAAAAGSVLKKTVLELGGSDPYLILEDADLPAAVEACVTSRMINGGQSCIAAKRFIVVEKVADEFERLFLQRMREVKMGDPLREDVQLGPQARRDLRDELHQQVEDSLARGAKLLLGGEIPEGPGAFYPPTVISDVVRGMPAYDQELFGPVAALIRVADEEEAIQVANTSTFGLGAAVFTGDAKKGEEIAARKLQAGCCFVNAFVKSDPRLPFGGIKESGYGRELGSHGIQEFCNIKTVYIK